MKILICLIATSAIILSTKNSLAQDSIIQTAMDHQDSIVSVLSIVYKPAGQKKSSAALDPRTGRVLVASQMRTVEYQRKGAGIIIDASGLIVTNLHTIRYANKIAVRLHNGEVLNVKILDLKPEFDLALIKIEDDIALNPISFADSDQLSLGQEVINIGHSELLNETISGGRIISLATKAGNPKSVEFIKANIKLYHGDSGGPLLDNQGHLIGLVMGKINDAGQATVAIPSNKIKNLCHEFMK